MPFIITSANKPTQSIFKDIMFYFDIKNKIVYAQAHYLDKAGHLYWPVVKFNAHDIDAIYNYSINFFQKMKLEKSYENCEPVDLPVLMQVKTFAGAIRKLEFYSFNWTDWQYFYFCKGERGVDSYSMFIETRIGKEINKELFSNAYNVRLKKLERKRKLPNKLLQRDCD